ncbi:MAG: polynucleotide adenylyltransferase PcnB [Gammaproteobacteria bacterium]|nr:polynucleotide adenylyltransferase PcnB [Gammaproteobacteria bacterium]
MSNRERDSSKLTIIPRKHHKISRKSISEAALKVLYRLDKSGHRACLVGGGVRDLLLGKHPKDFDVATDATPEQIRQLFRNSRIIGRRFRLVHIRFGREIIEVATFRGHSNDTGRSELNTDGRIIRDNTFGDIEEDAIRRDFTINALYYDIRDFSILDYTNGLVDIESRTLRMIGDAEIRYQEDPVRMLRAIRFAGKLDFQIDRIASDAIFKCAPLLEGVPAARLFDEIVKLFHCGNASRVFILLRQFQLLKYLVPSLDNWINGDPDAEMLDFIDQSLVNTDARVNSQVHVSPAFIFAVLLWPVVQQRASQLCSNKMKIIAALDQAGGDIFTEQIKTVSIPRRYSQMAKDIWTSQPRFQRTKGKYPRKLIGYPSFRAAYDFMCIQSMVGLIPKEICSWWTDYQLKHKPIEATRPQSSGRPDHRRKRNSHAS